MTTPALSPIVHQRPVRRLRRRALLGGAVALAALGPSAALARSDLDAGVARALKQLFALRPGARALAEEAAGMLVIPDILKGGFILGGAYGEGALVIGGETDSYWSYTAASLGVQAGAQRTRQVLFFMTRAALSRFLRSDGVEMGLDAEVTVIEAGAELSVDTTRGDGGAEVIVMVYGRAGLLGGASYVGGAYRRL